jgi:hypothetical protein
MAGYTPIFDSVFQGSLCGKYPDLPVWLVLLALQQRGGVIDAHPSYIATVSGLPQEDIEKAIATFCQPDPSSRTPDHDGRRLEPLAGRGFGWRVLNHEKYRAMARKKEYDDQRTESGSDAARKAASRRVPTCPDVSRRVPLSESESKTDKKKNLLGDKSPEWVAIRGAYPKRKGDHRWNEALIHANARIREGATPEDLLLGVARYAGFIRAEGKEHTPYVKQAATFFGKDKAYLEPWIATKGDRFANAI